MSKSVSMNTSRSRSMSTSSRSVSQLSTCKLPSSCSYYGSGANGIYKVCSINGRSVGVKFLKKPLKKTTINAITTLTNILKEHAHKHLARYFVLPLDLDLDVSNRACTLDGKKIWFYTQKHIDGETLQSLVDRLKAHRTMRTTQATAELKLIHTQIVEVISFLQSNNLYHNDLKSDNIIVTHNPVQIHVIDWDLLDARFKNATDQCNELVFYPYKCAGKLLGLPEDEWQIGRKKNSLK